MTSGLVGKIVMHGGTSVARGLLHRGLRTSAGDIVWSAGGHCGSVVAAAAVPDRIFLLVQILQLVEQLSRHSAR